MKHIYIDYTTTIAGAAYSGLSKHFTLSKESTYGGGSNYSSFLITTLLSKYQEYKFTLLWPKDHLPQTEQENIIYNNKNLSIKQIKSLSDDFELNEGSTLFLPLMRRPSNYASAARIKKKYPSVGIIAVVHDFGTQFNNYGLMSRYYFTGWKYRLFLLQKPGYWFLHSGKTVMSKKRR